MWVEDLKVGDQVVSVAKFGAAKGQYEVQELGHRSVLLRKCVAPGVRGRPTPFSYDEIEELFEMPDLDTRFRFGQRALLLVRTVYDDGRVSLVPWVEGAECPFDGGDGTTFEFLGMVDSRANSLELPDLWAHKEELVAGTYRFFGEYTDPNVGGRATNPDVVEEAEKRLRRGPTTRRRR